MVRPPKSSPKKPAKRERNAAETKRRILEAAVREFAGKGFDGARLGSIARAAEVQQALIHHYFADKEGLHAEVVRAGLAAMTEGAWALLAQMEAGAAQPKRNANANAKTGRRRSSDLQLMAEGFVDLMLRFFADNGAFFAILRHELERSDVASTLIGENVGPLFDAIVRRLDEMRARGEVRRDVDARHLVLSCVSMIAFPFQEERFVSAVWPADWHSHAFLAERKKQVVEMILARVLP